MARPARGHPSPAPKLARVTRIGLPTTHAARSAILVALALLTLNAGVAGCSRTPPARIGEPLSLAAGSSAVGPWTQEALPFSSWRADRKLAGGAEKRRAAYVADARRRGMDVASLTRAFEVAETVRDGTRALVASVHPATVDRTKAWLFVVAWGYEGERLLHARVWVVDASSGSVLDSASVRL